MDSDIEMYINNELERLYFVEGRDGMDGALKFARQTYQVYRTNVLRSRKNGFDIPSHASLPEYRRMFIGSIIAINRYLKEATCSDTIWGGYIHLAVQHV
jgi:hypothetical protein